MCLTIPGRIESIEGGPAERQAHVDFGGTRRTVNLVFVPEARVGDYILAQAGFATQRLEETDALEALRYARDLDRVAAREGGLPAGVD